MTTQSRPRQLKTVTVSASSTDDVDAERSTHDWIILDCGSLFNNLDQSKKLTRRAVRRLGNNDQRQLQSNVSELELISDQFICGQTVNRTSSWQMELRSKGGYLCVSLVCINCLNEEVNEIWVRFDTDIIDFDGVVLYTAGSASFFHSENLTNFTPRMKIRARGGVAAKNAQNSYWEADILPISDLVNNWTRFVPRNILNLRLRMYVYREKPLNQARHIAELREPVKLCYTDSSRLVKNPFLEAVKTLWDTMENANVGFKINEKVLRAHKFVVSVQSPVLKKMIAKNSENKNDGVVEVSGCSSETFQGLLKFLYTQDAEEVKAKTDVDFISGLLKVAGRFEVMSLFRICMVRLLINMTVENFGQTALAIYSNAREGTSYFKTEIKKFFMENQCALQKSEDLRALAKTNRDVFLQICFQPIEIIEPSSDPPSGDNASPTIYL